MVNPLPHLPITNPNPSPRRLSPNRPATIGATYNAALQLLEIIADGLARGVIISQMFAFTEDRVTGAPPVSLAVLVDDILTQAGRK